MVLKCQMRHARPAFRFGPMAKNMRDSRAAAESVMPLASPEVRLTAADNGHCSRHATGVARVFLKERRAVLRQSPAVEIRERAQ